MYLKNYQYYEKPFKAVVHLKLKFINLLLNITEFNIEYE